MWMLLVPLRGSDCVFSPYQHGCHGQGTVKKKHIVQGQGILQKVRENLCSCQSQ